MDNLVLRFDMRYPAHCTTPVDAFYHAAIEMSAWADQHQFSAIGFSEHHNTDDGFLPSPLALASAVAARTEHTMVAISALLAPLHDPIRLAEDLAILDILSRGRSIATVGLGYRPEEYLALGKSWQQRGQLLDDSISTLLKAWSGEPFTHNGATVQVLPRPYSRPHPILCVGGNSKAAARRAARFGLPFSPAIDDEELAKVYYEESVARGFTTPYVIMPQHPATTFIAEDPQRAWTQLGEFMLYDALAYGRWRHKTRRAYAESFAGNLEELKAEGKYRILTPEQAISVAKTTGSMHFAPLVGGTPPELGWQSLELFAAKVQPYL
jgi:alkanesulfonate monooxygenase SsuD/methylene tetrahydromethanopterin reductase-like flavin-dependent oxidoreductase (luciferase family)